MDLSDNLKRRDFFLLFSYKMKHFGFTNFLLTLKNLKKWEKIREIRLLFSYIVQHPFRFHEIF